MTTRFHASPATLSDTYAKPTVSHTNVLSCCLVSCTCNCLELSEAHIEDAVVFAFIKGLANAGNHAQPVLQRQGGLLADNLETMSTVVLWRIKCRHRMKASDATLSVSL